MQKVYFFLILSLFTLTLQAQYVPVYPLAEHFTNTRCILCPPRNATFYQTIDSYSTLLHQVSYHPPVPYNQDTFYLQNPIPQDTRRQFYGVNGTPRAFFNGIDVRQGTELLPVSAVENSVGKQTGMEVQLDELVIQGEMQVLVSVRTVNQDSLDPSSSYKLFVILVEDSVDYAAPNGESLHRNIFRENLTSIEGDPFSTPAEGAAVPFSYQYQLNPGWDSTQVHALAFIFDQNGNFVNSGSRSNLRVSSSSTASNNQNDATATVIAQGGTPPYTYQWNDPNSQTTATAIGLNGGEYLVTVTDSLGTSIQELVFVETRVSNEPQIQFKGHIFVKDRSIQLIDFPNEKVKAEVFSLDGKKVYSSSVYTTQDIKLGDLSYGLYVIQVSGSWGIWKEKFRLN